MKRFVLLLGALIALVSCNKAPAPLPRLYQLPQFTLTERSGGPFDASTMRGKVWVADFFFASCPGVCLDMSKRMAYVKNATLDLPDVRLLSISTDEKDTPEVLKTYANQHGAGDRWFFVTGEKSKVFDISVTGFKLALADGDGVDLQNKFIHSTKLVLIDREGWIRGYYDGVGDKKAEDTARLLADIKRLHESK